MAEAKTKKTAKTANKAVKDAQTSKSLHVQQKICIDLAAKEADKKDRIISAKDALKISKILYDRLIVAERKLENIKKQVL